MASVNIGDIYTTQIPSLQDNADIQTAFLLYHYGQEAEPETYEDIVSGSISGHLKDLQDSKIDKDAIKIVSGEDNDFDSKTTTGFYSLPEAIASATNGIPTVNGSKYPGLLSVVYEPSDGIVYQTYYMTDGTTNGVSEKAWRAKYNNAWTSWKFDNSHVHDASSITSGVLPIARGGTAGNTPLSARTSLGAQAANVTTANAVLVTDGSGNITPSATITTTELGYLDNVTSAVQTQVDSKPTQLLGNKSAGVAVPSGTKRIVIARDNGSGAPDATITPAEGDIWFW